MQILAGHAHLDPPVVYDGLEMCDLSVLHVPLVERADDGRSEVRVEVGQPGPAELTLAVDSADDASAVADDPPADAEGLPVLVVAHEGQPAFSVKQPCESMLNAVLEEVTKKLSVTPKLRVSWNLIHQANFKFLGRGQKFNL